MCCASPWSIVLVATSCLFGCATATAQAPRELSRSWTNDLADPVATPPIEERGEKQHSTEELRRTIDAKVLDRLTRSIEDHVHLVETGERAARPFVTLTYAQSIDGSIAAADKSQVGLSGKESQVMTHGLRSIHDAILVGAGTVRQDNPRLNVRHWPPRDPSLSTHQRGSEDDALDKTVPSARGGNEVVSSLSPRAVILADRLSALPRRMRMGGAIIFTNLSSPDAWRWLAEWGSRSREGSEDRAANNFVIVHCGLTVDGRCNVRDCLEKLYSMGFRSLMVEGGATVIASFLRGLDSDSVEEEVSFSWEGGNLVDRVVVTITPTFLQGYNVLAKPRARADGAIADGASGFPLHLFDVSYVQLGEDIVVIGEPGNYEDPR